MNSDHTFAAFVSYSSRDSAFARRLHRALEAYRIPKSLGAFVIGSERHPNRIYPVFRDREELATGSLAERIEAALENSRNLIVICSANAAQSPWVAREIEAFRALGRGDRIFTIIADTALSIDEDKRDVTRSLFPAVLLADPGKNEPVAADARRRKDGFDNAVIKLIAGLIGVSPGKLLDREKRRRTERALTRAGFASIGVLAVALGVTTIAEMGRRSDVARSEGNLEAFISLAPPGSIVSTAPEASLDRAVAYARLAAVRPVTLPDRNVYAWTFSADETMAFIGLAQGGAALVPTGGGDVRTIAGPACRDDAATIWQECAVRAIVEVDASAVAVGDARGVVSILSTDGGVLVSRKLHDHMVVGFATSNAARQIVSVDAQGGIVVASIESLTPSGRYQTRRPVRRLIGLSSDGRQVALELGDSTLAVYVFQTQTLEAPEQAASGGPVSLASIAIDGQAEFVERHFFADADGVWTYSLDLFSSEARQSDRYQTVAITNIFTGAQEEVRTDAPRGEDGVRQIILGSSTAWVSGDRGEYVRLGDDWAPAPRIFSRERGEFSRSGRLIGFVESSRGDLAVLVIIDLRDYAAFNQLIDDAGPRLRQEICRSRWASRLPRLSTPGEYDAWRSVAGYATFDAASAVSRASACDQRGLLDVDGWAQLPQSFAQLWTR